MSEQIVCSECGECVTLAQVHDGEAHGVECQCEYRNGNSVGAYVEVANIPDRWEVENRATEGSA